LGNAQFTRHGFFYYSRFLPFICIVSANFNVFLSDTWQMPF
jgi:hypothetical protein